MSVKEKSPPAPARGKNKTQTVAAFVAATLLATSLLPLAQPAAANDIVIGSDVSGHDVLGNSSAADGSLNDLPASGNSVTINAGGVVNPGGVYGGAVAFGSGESEANNNTVTLNGGSVGFGVTGGNANVWGGILSAIANSNTVTVNSGSVGGGISGGYATVSRSAQDVATNGNSSPVTAISNNNTVTISGGSVGGGISGGYANAGDYYGGRGSGVADGNTVSISGGTVSGDVYGGYAESSLGSGTATNNTVTIEGNTALDLSGANIYGGMGGGYDASGWQDKPFGDASVTAGNTFNLKRSGVTVAGLYNFENLNFYLPTDLGNGGTMLTVTGEAYIDKANVNVGINGASSPLRVGDTVNLIDAGTLTGTPANDGGTVNGSGMQGVTIIYDFKVYTEGNKLMAEVLAEPAAPPTPEPTPTSSPSSSPSPSQSLPSSPPTAGTPEPPPPVGQPGVAGHANPQAKSLNEGFTAPVTLVNIGSDMIATKGMALAVQAASPASGTGGGGSSDSGGGQGGAQGVGAVSSPAGVSPFGAIGAGSMTYNTGSSVDVDYISLVAGLAHAIDYEQHGRMTLGAFVEYGHGGYDTYNSFPNQASVHGSGNIDNIGGGLLGRLDLQQGGQGASAGGPYFEGSARIGQVRSDFASNLHDAMGTAASYDTSSMYYGVHVGTGYLLPVTANTQADVYARLLWTHQGSDDVRISTGEIVNFDSVDSLRTMLGARYNWAVKPWLTPYIGAGWEHEFDGKTGSSVNGIALDQPSLGGDTGMGEIGASMGASASWDFDLGVQGYVGAREGVAGTIKVVYRW